MMASLVLVRWHVPFGAEAHCAQGKRHVKKKATARKIRFAFVRDVWFLPFMDTIPMPTPADIEAAAAVRGLSIAAVCRRADIDQTAFQRWKAGKSMPSLRIIQKMVDAIEAVPIPPMEAL
jgi:hypothetical protein